MVVTPAWLYSMVVTPAWLHSMVVTPVWLYSMVVTPVWLYSMVVTPVWLSSMVVTPAWLYLETKVQGSRGEASFDLGSAALEADAFYHQATEAVRTYVDTVKTSTQ